MQSRSSRGFSLLELMVVVAVIGIFSTIAVPKYQAYKARAVVAEAVSTLTSIWTSQQAYFMANDTYAQVAESWATHDQFWYPNALGIIIPLEAKYYYGTYTSVDPNMIAYANYKLIWTHRLASCSIMVGDARYIWQDKSIAVNPSYNGLAGCP